MTSCLSCLHLLSSFRFPERCPQLGGCRPFPRSESSIERIRILVAEQKCHFLDIHLRPVEVLVRQFLPRLKKQLPESCAVIDYSRRKVRLLSPSSRAAADISGRLPASRRLRIHFTCGPPVHCPAIARLPPLHRLSGETLGEESDGTFFTGKFSLQVWASKTFF